MDNLGDILKKLAQHELKPADELFHKIWKEAVGVFPQGMEARLKELKDHSDIPGSRNFRRITEGISQPASEGKVHRRRYLFLLTAGAAAACLALVVTWFLSRPLKTSDTAVKNTPAAVIDPNGVLQKTDSGIKSTTVKGKLNRQEPTQTFNEKDGKAQRSFVLHENDILYSLMQTGFTGYEPFFKKNKLVLDIDQYSSPEVSAKMLSFMKVLYSTNRRKKPTIKARRAKRTLTRWKKADAAHFDSATGQKSALDIIDLTEFLIDYKRN